MPKKRKKAPRKPSSSRRPVAIPRRVPSYEDWVRGVRGEGPSVLSSDVLTMFLGEALEAVAERTGSSPRSSLTDANVEVVLAWLQEEDDVDPIRQAGVLAGLATWVDYLMETGQWDGDEADGHAVAVRLKTMALTGITDELGEEFDGRDPLRVAADAVPEETTAEWAASSFPAQLVDAVRSGETIPAPEWALEVTRSVLAELAWNTEVGSPQRLVLVQKVGTELLLDVHDRLTAEAPLVLPELLTTLVLGDPDIPEAGLTEEVDDLLVATLDAENVPATVRRQVRQAVDDARDIGSFTARDGILTVDAGWLPSIADFTDVALTDLDVVADPAPIGRYSEQFAQWIAEQPEAGELDEAGRRMSGEIVDLALGEMVDRDESVTADAWRAVLLETVLDEYPPVAAARQGVPGKVDEMRESMTRLLFHYVRFLTETGRWAGTDDERMGNLQLLRRRLGDLPTLDPETE